jgi:hypothetical protein
MKTIFSASYICSATLLACATATVSTQAWGQSSCSSDKQPAPTAILERFISADCDACWAAGSLPQPSKNQTSLDWIVPSPRGDEAALSAAAINDAMSRLQDLKLNWTAADAKMQTSAVQTITQAKAASNVRVAHGLPFNGYIGTSIAFTPSAALRASALQPKKLTPINHSTQVLAYLVLVETLPAGAEGSNIERNLVRNVLVTPWDLQAQLAKPRQNGFKPLFESRPLSLPQGVNPDRLKVIGWVQDAQGKILAAAQSRCAS